MDFRFINGKYVIQKDGVYLAITPEQIPDLCSIALMIQEHDLKGNQETETKNLDKPLPHALDQRGTTGDQDG